MNQRGMAAIAAAGLDVHALLSTPGAQLAAVRDQALGKGDSLPGGDQGGGRLLTVRAERARVIGSRQAFVRVLLALVERAAAAAGPGYGSIEFVWGASLEGLDLTARTATFSLGAGSGSGSGAQHQQSYDLLVAADGFASRCRRAAQAQAGGQLAVRVVPPNRQYKVRVQEGQSCSWVQLGACSTRPCAHPKHAKAVLFSLLGQLPACVSAFPPPCP